MPEQRDLLCAPSANLELHESLRVEAARPQLLAKVLRKVAIDVLATVDRKVEMERVVRRRPKLDVVLDRLPAREAAYPQQEEQPDQRRRKLREPRTPLEGRRAGAVVGFRNPDKGIDAGVRGRWNRDVRLIVVLLTGAQPKEHVRAELLDAAAQRDFGEAA
eukprot:6193006-Prymnesium_polylepis.1